MFNTNKTSEDYQNTTLFLNPPAGLIDTINRRYQRIWDLYKEMKSLDWDEDEFDYGQCMVDFKTAPKDTADLMLKTIMWQWEADSVVSRAPTTLIAPFNPCTEVWAAEQRICDNEQVHGNTYSQIIKMGMPFPEKVIEELLAETETFKRLDVITTELDNFARYSAKVNYEQKFEPNEALEHLLTYYFTILCLERIQFMASFAITFTICKAGWFQPIGMAVKKIAQDELEVHCEFRKEVITEILATDDGKAAYENVKDKLKDILVEVIEAELKWTKFIFDGRSLIGTNESIISNWVLFNAKDVARFMGIDLPQYKFPKSNPAPHLEDWLNMNNMQAAPQEQDLAQYKMGVVVNTDSGKKYDF